MSTRRYFGPALFAFLRDLEVNNNRQWFLANKARYESAVRDPRLEFIADFGRRLRGISRHYVADPRPIGGSMFRIHRDVRFSSDKRALQDECRCAVPSHSSEGCARPGLLSAPCAGASLRCERRLGNRTARPAPRLETPSWPGRERGYGRDLRLPSKPCA